MKNLVYLFVAVVMIAFNFSCSSDDTNSTEPDLSGDIVGKWKLEHAYCIERDEPISTTYCEKQATLDFSEEGILIDQKYYPDSFGGCLPQSTSYYTYYIDQNILYATYIGTTDTWIEEWEMLELTNTTLILSMYSELNGETYVFTYNRIN